MQNAGYAALQIVPSFKGFGGNLERGVDGPMRSAGTKGGAAYGDAAGKSAGSRFNRVFVGAAKLGLAGAVGAGALAFKLGKDAIGQASDLNESLNAVNVTYDRQATAVKKLGREAAESLGLSNTEFNGLAVQFSAFATQVAGGEGPKVIGVLDDLTTRGADFASVMNLEVNEALALFQSGLAGETEPLRKFGIDLSAAAVEAHALKVGIAEGKDALTESEKVQARYSLLMEQTAKTQGDFKNTSDSLANSQRILSARWDNAQAKLGKALLPVMQDLVGLILDKGIPAVEKFGDWFADEGIDHLKTFGGYAKDAAKFVGDLVGAFNKLPNEAKMGALGAAVGGIGAAKLSSGKGVAGAVGSAFGMTKPLPVFVTNPGFGAMGAGGTTAVAGAPAKGGSKIGGAAKAGGFMVTTALAFAFGDEAADAYMDGFERNSKWATRLGDSYESGLGDMLKETISTSAGMVKNFDKLPKTIKTRFDLLGVPESKKHAIDLAKTYNLTPKEKRTMMRVLGYREAESATQRLIKQYNLTPGAKTTNFELNGIDSARQKLISFSQDLAQVRDKTVTVNTVFTSSGKRFKEFGGAGADGMTVPGARSPYGDKMMTFLAPGEEVISNRHGQADRHRNLLKAINAGRFADGGTVGAVRPLVNVGGPSVHVFLDGREIDARVESRFADHSTDAAERRTAYNYGSVGG